MKDATGQTNYACGADGQMLQQISAIYGNNYTTACAYDGAGRTSTMSYPSEALLTYQYDGVGRLSTLASNIAEWGTLADSFRYQPATDSVDAIASITDSVWAA